MPHMHHYRSSSESGRKLAWAIVFNAIIAVAEIVGGLVSGYLALLADAVHNLSDVAALGLAWLGWRGSKLPPTKRSTYGFVRIEVVTAFVSAVALVVIAIFILIEAWRRFVDPQPISHPWLFLTVAVIGLMGNLLSIWLLHSEKATTLNMKTAFLHMFYDALSSIVVIGGGIVMLVTDWYVVDVFLSAAIALMIFWSSWLVIKEAVLILMETVPQGIEYDAVYEAILSDPSVRNVHDLHIWSLSSSDIALSCHIGIFEEHLELGSEIIERVGRRMQERFGIGHSTIQLETKPCAHSDLSCRNGEQSWG